MSGLIKNNGYGENPNVDEVGPSLTRFVEGLDKGKPLTVKGGTNGYHGTATLVAGTVTVANTAVRTGDKIYLSRAVADGTPGWLTPGTITNKVSFVINSSSNTDTSQVNWTIVRSAS